MKKTLLILGLVCLGVINLLVFRSGRLLEKARETGNVERRIKILEKSSGLFPFNDEVYRELGWAHFLLGENNLADVENRDKHFARSTGYFVKAGELNPGAYQTHFYYAQALSHMRFFTDTPDDYFEEYRKAAVLTYSDNEVYYRVGLAFLSLWTELSEEDKAYAIELLKNGNVFQDSSKAETILQTWASITDDTTVMDRILPRNPDIFRRYARFLGERAISLAERHKKMSMAEFMDFEHARRTYNLGREHLRYHRLSLADERFRDVLRTLERIHFYQNLAGDKRIDPGLFLDLKKSVYSGLVMVSARDRGRIDKINEYLSTYVDLEKDATPFNELEKYLERRNVFGEESGGAGISRRFCRIFFDYIQNRYNDVIKIGEDLKSVPIPDSGSTDIYVKIYRMIGDSYQKQDFLYDAQEYFQKALELDPDNLDTLTTMLFNQQRLNNPSGIRDVQQKMEQTLTPAEASLNETKVEKGETREIQLRLLEGETNLMLFLEPLNPDIPTLVSIFFGGRIIWEDYIGEEGIPLKINGVTGNNALEIQPVSGSVRLLRILRINKAVTGEEKTVNLSK